MRKSSNYLAFQVLGSAGATGLHMPEGIHFPFLARLVLYVFLSGSSALARVASRQAPLSFLGQISLEEVMTVNLEYPSVLLPLPKFVSVASASSATVLEF
jgi:hypothetical protein